MVGPLSVSIYIRKSRELITSLPFSVAIYEAKTYSKLHHYHCDHSTDCSSAYGQPDTVLGSVRFPMEPHEKEPLGIENGENISSGDD